MTIITDIPNETGIETRHTSQCAKAQVAFHRQKVPVRMKQQLPVLNTEGCNQHVNCLANGGAGDTAGGC